MTRINPRALLSAALLATVTVPLAGAHVQQAPTAEATSPSAVAPTAKSADDPRAERLERALAAIQPRNARADIFFIASDELRGRDTPSRGLRIAARYIRARLERLGFQPGAPEGSFFWNYTLTQNTLDEENTFATYTVDGVTRRLAFGRDYFLFPTSLQNRDGEGGILFGGTFADDDTQGVDFGGHWVLLRPGTRVSKRRSESAAKAGVLGFLVPAKAGAEKSVADAFQRYTSYMRKPSLFTPRANRLPSLHLSEELSQSLWSDDLEVGDSLPGTFRESWKIEAKPVELENVCGLWPGSDPVLRNEVIIISAHYDHIGVSSNGEINNGADDNGSGTTGLMAIAEALEAYGPMRRTVLLLWVSGEEKGLLGSAAWTKDPWLPEGMHPICDLNIDMIGRNAPDEIGITPTKQRREYNLLTRLVEKHMGEEGFNTLNSADAYWARSDHANFSQNLHIPVAFLFSDVHEDYHQPTDTPDKIDVGKLTRVARLVVRVLDDLQEDTIEF